MKNAEDAGQVRPEAESTHSREDEEAKVFTQADVNRIVQERLARERERINSMINEDEGIRKELLENRLRLDAAKELSEAGCPMDLLDLVDCADEERCRDSIGKIRKVYELAYQNAVRQVYRSNGRTPGRGGMAAPAEDKLRNAFLTGKGV